MTDKEKPPSSTRTTAAIIKHYEAMSAADIEAELVAHGLNPRPTVEAVTRLVQEKLEEWRRGGHHRKNTMTAIAAGTTPSPQYVPATPSTRRLSAPRRHFNLPPNAFVLPGTCCWSH